MTPLRLDWYVSRLKVMSPGEVAWRSRDHAMKLAWRRRQVHPGELSTFRPHLEPILKRPAPLPAALVDAVPARATERLLDVANPLLDGRWTSLGVEREDLVAPDWFLDPLSGRRAAQDRYAFSINHRSEEETGNIKQLWELSRHHHLTVLAAAWFLTRDDRYAEMVERDLTSWWQANPFLSGVNWISGIEVGIRLISWTWIRRLLDGWDGVGDLFEHNALATRQLHWHQEYLATFNSVGSSANNHVIAEAAGQLIASCGLPWFPESDSWRRQAATLLERQFERNTFPSGVNRELATSYHGFVAELIALAAVEAGSAGFPLGHGTLVALGRMFDAAASLVDEAGRPPRQGDDDDGRTLVVDDPDGAGWSSLLATGAALFGSLDWWQPTLSDVRSTLLVELNGKPRSIAGRPSRRWSHFADAGITVLRTVQGRRPEIWCRCDGGPQGFLTTAAHGHADALSIEVRHGGVDLLVDPGTYCYHGEPEWRNFFRSTLAHNTLELAGRDQSRSGGPFLWLDHAHSRVVDLALTANDGIQQWAGEHRGYASLEPAAVHRRRVTLDTGTRRLSVTDQVDSAARHPCRLAFHLGPTVEVHLADRTALLRWTSADGPGAATLTLPVQLHWTLSCGATEPISGWYSARFGVKEPASTLIGAGACGLEDVLLTTLDFDTSE